MTRKLQTATPDDETPRAGESFLARVHRRKTEARVAELAVDHPQQPPETDHATPAKIPPELTDADMPALESLNPDSDYSGFLSPRVSEQLQRAALRKLFHSATFNVVDELDDYAEDFTTFEVLGDIVTADMRHQIEMEAKKKAEEMKRAVLEADSDTAAEGIEVDTTSDQADAAPDEAVDPAADPGDPETDEDSVDLPQSGKQARYAKTQ
jgi:hypothetical protein